MRRLESGYDIFGFLVIISYLYGQVTLSNMFKLLKIAHVLKKSGDSDKIFLSLRDVLKVIGPRHRPEFEN